MRRSRVSASPAALLALTALSLAACGSAPPPAPARADLLNDFDPATFAGARAVLAGFDPPGEAEAMRIGDRCLLGLDFRNGDAVRRWLLDLEVVEEEKKLEGKIQRPGAAQAEPIQLPYKRIWPVRIGDSPVDLTSRICSVRVRILDASGTELATSVLELPRDFLAIGFAAACRASAAQAPSARTSTRPSTASMPAGELARQGVGPVIALVELLQFVQNDRVLGPFFWQVVRRPSVWSVLGSLGVRANLSVDASTAVQARNGPAHLAWCTDTWVLPMTVEVNREPALYCQFLVGSAAPPLTAIGGILAAQGQHPSDPERWFTLVLLAARRRPTPPC